MYGVYREFLPPLGVTHAVRGRFGTSSSSQGVVFARKNSIDVYIVRANSESARLDLLCSTPLGATITSISAIRRTTPPDLLCVGFDRMRVSFLAWHPSSWLWTTEQLLDLGDFLGTPGCSPDGIRTGLDSDCKWRPLLRGCSGSNSQPVIRADPSGRCLAILSTIQNLFYIIPIRSDEDLAGDDERVVMSSTVFVVDLPSEFDASNVKDFTFLHGMFEPSVVILYENNRTWSGRSAVQRNTCSLLTVSLDLRSKRSTKSWSMDQLPYDCYELEAVPESARGGVLVISANAIMQIRHGSCVAGLSLNCYGDIYAEEIRSKYDSINKSNTVVECDAAHCRFLDLEESASDQLQTPHQSVALLSLKGGELYFIHVAVDSRNTIVVKRAGSTVIASEIVPINERFFILSSRLSDSLLIELKRVQDESVPEPRSGPGAHENTAGVISKPHGKPDENGKPKSAKRSKRKRSTEEDAEYEMMYGAKPPQDSSDEESDEGLENERTLDLHVNDEKGTRGVYDDDDELGFVFKVDTATDSTQGTGHWVLTVKDTISCFGPGSDVAVGCSPQAVVETQWDMVVAGGYAKNGCLAVVYQSVRPTFYTEFNVPGCNGIWSLLDPVVTREQRMEMLKRNEAIAKRNEAIRERNMEVREARKRFVQEAIKELKEERLRELINSGTPVNSNGIITSSSFTPDPAQNASQYADAQSEANVIPNNENVGSFTNSGSGGAVLAEKLPSLSPELGLSTSERDMRETESSLQGPSGKGVDEARKHVTGSGEGGVIEGKNQESPKIGEENFQPRGSGIESGLERGEVGTIEPQIDTITQDNAKDELSATKDSTFENRAETGESRVLQKPNEGERDANSLESPQSRINDTDEVMADSQLSKELDISKQLDDKVHVDSPGVVAKRRKFDDQKDINIQIIANPVKADDIEIDRNYVLQIRRQAEESILLEEEEVLETAPDGAEFFHSYMLLSTADSSTVLTTQGDLEEVTSEQIEFVFTDRTVAAGNVLENCAIVQVASSIVRVIMDGKKQCDYALPEGSTQIRNAQVSDPLILIQTDDDAVIVLRVEAEPFEASVQPKKPDDEFLGDEVFDEYGMAVVDLKGDRDSTKESGDALDEKLTEQFQSYRNFEIKTVFRSTDLEQNDASISCAHLYTGALSDEVALDGLLERNDLVKKDESGPNDALALNGDDKNGSTATEGNDEIKERDESRGDRLDDEDRMLYGDDVGDDEEDIMLYGADVGDENSDDALVKAAKGATNSVSIKESTIGSTEPAVDANPVPVASEKGVLALGKKTSETSGHLLVLVTKNGELRILSAELKFETIFSCPFFYTAPDLMADFFPESIANKQPRFPKASNTYQVDNVVMTEIAASCHLQGFSTPLLVAITRTGIPLVYRAFLSPDPPAFTSFRSRLTFKRISYRDSASRWCTRLMKKACNRGYDQRDENLGLTAVQFENISGRSGLFLGGECPAFMFAERGYPRIHEICYMNRTGQTISREEYENGQGVQAFAEFHIASCPRGFAYVGDDGIVRIGALPEAGDVNYDAPAPFRKISLRCTPHKVAYHRGSQTYGVLASMPTLTTREERLARILQSLEKHDKRHYLHTAAQAEAETGDESGDRVPPLFEELHELRVYRPDNWNLIKSHKLQKGEVGLAITNMKIDVYKQRTANGDVEIASSNKGDDGNESLFAASLKLRPKDVLVVGTGYLNGEDSSSRGRLLVFEVSRQEVYTEAGGVYTAFQLQLIAEKELVSPVTAVAPMEGYVIASVGPLVSVYKLVGDEIVHLSFAFGQLYCTSIASLKQYVVTADMAKSVSFMYFRERNKSVNFLGQDYEMVQSYATEFLIENDNVSIILTDGDGHIRLLNYVHASVPKSRGGKRLLLNGAIQIGSRINKMVRVREPDPVETIANGTERSVAGNQGLVFATLDGGIGAIIAVTKEEFENVGTLEKAILGRMDDGSVGERCGGISMVEISEFEPYERSTEMLDQRLVDSRVLYDALSMPVVELRTTARESSLGIKKLVETLSRMEHIMCRF